LEENERNKKLKIIYFERKNKLETLMKEHERIKDETVQHPNQEEK